MQVGSHHGIPDEPIWVFYLVEEAMGVIEIEELQFCGEFEKAARSEGVVDESRDDHLGVDLIELFQIEAFLQMGF